MKHLKRSILKPILLFVGLFALAQVASAWGYYKIQEENGSGSYPLTWNSTIGAYEVTIQNPDNKRYFVCASDNNSDWTNYGQTNYRLHTGYRSCSLTNGGGSIQFEFPNSIKVIVNTAENRQGWAPNKVTIEDAVYPRIIGDEYGNWNYTNSTLEIKVGNGSTNNLTVSNWQGGNFKIALANGKRYSTSSSTALQNNVEYTLTEKSSDGSNMSLPYAASGKNITFTLSLNSSGVPTKIKAVWEASYPKVLYLASDFFNGGWWGDNSTPGMHGSEGNSTDGYKVFSYTFDINDTNNDHYFQFRNKNKDGVWPAIVVHPENNDDAASVGENAAYLDTWNSGASSSWKFKAPETGKYTFTVDLRDLSNPKLIITKGDAPQTTSYYLHARFLNNWDATKRVKFEPKDGSSTILTATAKAQNYNSSNNGFKITNKETADNGTWYTLDPSTTLENETEYTLTSHASTDEKPNIQLPDAANGKNVTFTLTLGEDGKPEKIKAEWNTSVEPVVNNNIRIIGYLKPAGIDYDNWKQWNDGIKTNTGGVNSYYKFTPTQSGTIYLGFMINETRYYPWWNNDDPTLNDNEGSSEAKAFNEQKGSSDQWKYNVESGKTYILVIKENPGASGDTPNAYFTISEFKENPVYPIGVYSETELRRYDKWPVLYLKGSVLNNNRITPEYQMNKITDDRYELEFTARNSYSQNSSWKGESQPFVVAGYSDMESHGFDFTRPVSVDLENDFGRRVTNTETADDRKFLSEGARLKAICEKVDGTWTLRFEKADNTDINDVPFIAMVGSDWEQRVKTDTPAGKTENGWQESWIQYDSKGQILLDRAGKVMYNTMWPPRNPILFKTTFKVNDADQDFTLSSKDITFTISETKTGKYWKDEFKEKGFNIYDLNITRTFSVPENATVVTDNGYGENTLALDDYKLYTLYKVNDMWINGKVKLWTGWGGLKSGNANWNHHANWGHLSEIASNKESDKGCAKITPQTTVQLSTKDGDMRFDEPTYFKTVYLFYEAVDQGEGNDAGTPNSKGHNVLFTELSKGGAQIAAISTDNYTVANYQPALMSLQGMTGYKIKNVDIWSYSTSSNGNNVVEERQFNVYSMPPTADYTAIEFDKLFEDKTTSAGLNASATVTDSSSKAKWVKDTETYTNGDYFYRMTITLVDGDGHEITETVDSNPFSIFRDNETITVKVYQLVKTGDHGDNEALGTEEGGEFDIEDGKRVGHYFTFRGSDEDASVPTLPAYEVWITGDDKYDGENNNVEYDENGQLISGYIDDSGYKFRVEACDELPDYSDPMLYFTDKVLVISSVPSSSSINGYYFNAYDKSNTPASAPAREGMMKSSSTEEFDRSAQREDYDNRFMHITNVATLMERECELKMSYSNTFLDAEGKPKTASGVAEASANYQVSIPEPILTDCRVQVFYGDTDETQTDNDTKTTFTFRGLPLTYVNEDGNTVGARFHSVRDYIKVDYPNVSTLLQERMMMGEDGKVETGGLFKLTLEGDVSGITDKNDEGNTENGNNPDKPTVTTWKSSFEFGSEGVPGLVTGPVMHPSNFNKVRKMSLVYPANDGSYSFYKRAWTDDDGVTQYGWRDRYLTPIYLTDYAPIQIESSIKDAKLYYDMSAKDDEHPYGNLISMFTIVVRHKSEYIPSEANDEDPEGNENNNHNYIYHLAKASDGIIVVDPSDFENLENPNLATADGVVFQHDHLRHHSDLDYYYVTVFDAKSAGNNTTDTSGYIISESGNIVGAEGKDGEEPLHFVVPSTKLLSSAATGINSDSSEYGYEITVKKNYGNVGSDGKAWDYYNNPTHRAFIEKIVGEDHFSKDLKVSVSYLYPFAVAETQSTPANGRMRVVSDYSGDVLKSQANEVALPELKANDVWTSLEGVYDEFSGLAVGDGYIDVDGTNVMIIATDGAIVAQGAGRHYVGKGVYVVRYNGRTTKVVVK